jgi:excisionase family DNA binding protein
MLDAMTRLARNIKQTQPARFGVRATGRDDGMWSSQSASTFAWPTLPVSAEASTAFRAAKGNRAPMLSPAAVADRLGVCVETVCREIRDSNLMATKVRGQWRISKEGLGRYVSATDRPLRLYAHRRKGGSPS